MKTYALTILLSLVLISAFSQTKYVKPTSSGTGDGSSWANALGDLQATLAAASSGDIIWVAAGTYKPTTGTDRSISFVIPSGVQLYGGFAGDESAGFNLFQRDFEANATILSGEIGGSGITDNTHHVVSTSNVSDETIVDGFTITKGYGIGGSNFGNGGGWLNVGNSKPQVRNIIFKLNTGASGGAMYNNGFNGDASPTISNCVFISNNATSNGGAVYNRGTSGLANTSFLNCTFHKNDADNLGGAIYNFNVIFILIRNSILWDNQQLVATSTPVLNDYYNDGTSPMSKTVMSKSIISESGCPQNGGITDCNTIFSGNPNFLNPNAGDLRLTASSTLAIDKGANNNVSAQNDLGNNQRIRNGIVDIGAYEYAGKPTKIFVDQSVTSNSLGHTWDNALTNLQDALAFSLAGDSIWVAKGTYKPTTTTNRTISFQIPDSVQVYGGFAGNEMSDYDLSQRNFVTNETILSGDIGTPSNDTDNTYNVVYTEGVSAHTTLNGFTITKGNASVTFGGREERGGGMYNDGKLSGPSNPTIAFCFFFSNAAQFGGGLYNMADTTGAKANPLLISCSFTSNTANDYGGAIYNDGAEGESSPVLTACSFTSNTANSIGGAIYNDGYLGESSPEMTDCSFTSNTAINSGGAIYNDGYLGQSSPVLTACSFTSNTASNIGGAIYNDGAEGESSPVLTACSFTSNTANNFGGAIYNDGAEGESSPVLTACSFTSNTANSIGGAICWNGDGGDISSLLTNCLFSNNGKDHVGYDDGDEDTQPHFINCTFYGATQYSINIVFFDSGKTPIDFTNCIFWNNNGDIVNNDAAVNIQYSLVDEAAFTQGAFSGNNNINADPKFVNAEAGFFNLQCDSPAINQGTPTEAPTSDITGFSRSGNPDMGAYEYGYAILNETIKDGVNPNLSGVPTITAQSPIENTNTVLLKGINHVEMLPGFQVAPINGAATVFTAEIDNNQCPQ